MARDHELEPEPKSMQRGLARAQHPHRRGRPARAHAVAVLRRLERDVVPEPPGLLVRIRVTADVDEQRREVDRGASRVVEAAPGFAREYPRGLILGQRGEFPGGAI